MWYLQFCSTGEDQIYNGAPLHVAYPILLIPFLFIPLRLQARHQQAWCCLNKPVYSVSSIRRLSAFHRPGIANANHHKHSLWHKWFIGIVMRSPPAYNKAQCSVPYGGFWEADIGGSPNVLAVAKCAIIPTNYTLPWQWSADCITLHRRLSGYKQIIC